ncbi:hypothetical protein [Persicobacter sp. CCB-QB2]|uniref:hypothetical protein n=1 Tax=Persicobacter sp. CCB-QB2 TaxID=1561025 RepID=UPI0006A99257|nr:hypothetical protein [Persicobacter sp. CCB-QB2]
MNRKKLFQSLLLVAILIFPVAVYLFLQAFGDNQYDIPVRYAKDSLMVSECGEVKVASLSWADDILMQGSFEGQVNILTYAPAHSAEAAESKITYLQKSLKKYPKVAYWMMTEASVSNKGIGLIAGSEEQLRRVFKCSFALEQKEQADHLMVLIDASGDLRGFFNYEDPVEIDRLKQEVSILYTQQD